MVHVMHGAQFQLYIIILYTSHDMQQEYKHTAHLYEPGASVGAPTRVQILYRYGCSRAPISRAGWELASGSLRGCRAGLERA